MILSIKQTIAFAKLYLMIYDKGVLEEDKNKVEFLSILIINKK